MKNVYNYDKKLMNKLCNTSLSSISDLYGTKNNRTSYMLKPQKTVYSV